MEILDKLTEMSTSLNLLGHNEELEIFDDFDVRNEMGVICQEVGGSARLGYFRQDDMLDLPYSQNILYARHTECNNKINATYPKHQEEETPPKTF